MYSAMVQRIIRENTMLQEAAIKTRARWYLFLFLGPVLLLSSSIMACGQPIPSLPSPISSTKQLPAAIESQTSEELHPVGKATNADEWNPVEVFTGQGNETTPPFHISGTKCRITWTIDAVYPEYAVFDLFIYPNDKYSIATKRVSYSGSNTNGTAYIYRGGRDYYIKVIAANLRSWTIVVENYAIKASLSPVQITRIHYKGTVHLPEPEQGLCFQRYEPDEYVEIKNLSDSPQNIQHWMLRNISKGYPLFIFPTYFPGTMPLEPCVLAPHQAVLVYTDEIHTESGSFTFYHGVADIWNNKIPDVAVLYNAAEEEVSRKSYTVKTSNRVSVEE